ncbi:MAG: hypothetical protein HOP08_00170 [Cyclobacteriaceae bacterium]|nr:hypothetical protein [Cyclobacteriaceae bacterium]
MEQTKPQLTFSPIIDMIIGFFGIQYRSGFQSSEVDPLYAFPHANSVDATNVITFAEALLLIASIATLRLKITNTESELILFPQGH